MAQSGNTKQGLMARTATLLLALLVSGITLAADSATQNGSVISIPVVVVGEVEYSVELTLVAGSSPAVYSLTAAAELSNADRSNAANFANNTLTIPSIQSGSATLSVLMTLINDSPIQFQVASTTTIAAESGAYDLFQENISAQIIDSRCSICHVSGGVAGATGLIYSRTGDDRVLQNFETLQNFAGTRDDAADYVMEKASGGLSHGGGTQLAVGSSDYNKLQEVLELLTTGSSSGSSNDSDFFAGVELLSAQATLRRAAILLAGRAPTEAEYASVATADDTDLRAAIRGLMAGDSFHDFLLESSNDRLLVRGTNDGNFLDGGGIFPNFINHRIDLQLADLDRGLSWSYDLARFINGVDRGLRDSPLELIAYVVENDLPYSEILTADYMMANPIATWAMGGTGNFANPEDYSDFQPITLDQYYTWSEDVVYTEVVEIQETRIDDAGSLFWKYPHAGVLNTQAFLFRYPTTATNRNRARARWTFFHFLDFDIEKSAPRTTDPVALADTNNPTLFNNNCTVCHANMDPVAGAFQMYAEEGFYRNNGYDSLDGFYKYPEDWSSRIYQEGDTWYRDMRAPGYAGEVAEGDNSLQWLAQQIVQDPAFATAAVKFWWPSVIGTDPVAQPEVQTDATYAAQLLAYNAQSASIAELAETFSSSGMLLKDLLVDLIMSPWFRAESVDAAMLGTVQLAAHDFANLGNERLLTPEQLTRKTTSLTGFTLDSNYEFDRDLPYSALASDYKLYYGGIDSAGVTRRAREMTALMSTVAMTHAVESACPIVLREFALEDSARKLFAGITEFTTPLTIDVEASVVPTHYDGTEDTVFIDVNLGSATSNVLVSINNGFCDWNEEDQVCDSNTYLEVERVDVSSPDGVTRQLYADQQTTQLSTDCAWLNGAGGFGLCNGSMAKLSYTPGSAGEHRITATVRAIRQGGEHPLAESLSISLGAESTAEPLESTAAGASAIKAKLVELYHVLHGEDYVTSDAELEAAYQLFVESWEEVRSLSNAADYANISWAPDLTCKFWSDYRIGDDMPNNLQSFEINYGNPDEGDYPWVGTTEEMSEYISNTGRDPFFAKQAWITVLIYLLSHYDYLYE